MFEHLKQPKDTTMYTLSRGVTDFGNLAQYNLYESGYSFLIITQVPRMLELLAKTNTTYKTLIDNYIHILEYDFRGMDGLENITGDTSTLTDGIAELGIITQVKMQSASTFSMRYFEKSGSVLTRVHELFLKGIKDPRTQYKHYHGLIESGDLDDGYENETFSFLYINTDNTGLKIEKAVLIVGAQPTDAEISIYNSEKGSIEFKEVSTEFNGFPITGNNVDKAAKEVLDWINNPSNPNHIIKNSDSFMYTGIDKIAKRSKN